MEVYSTSVKKKGKNSRFFGQVGEVLAFFAGKLWETLKKKSARLWVVLCFPARSTAAAHVNLFALCRLHANSHTGDTFTFDDLLSARLWQTQPCLHGPRKLVRDTVAQKAP